MLIDAKKNSAGAGGSGQSNLTTSMGTPSYYSSSQIEEQNQGGLPW